MREPEGQLIVRKGWYNMWSVCMNQGSGCGQVEAGENGREECDSTPPVTAYRCEKESASRLKWWQDSSNYDWLGEDNCSNWEICESLYELWDWAGHCGIEKVVMLWERKSDPYDAETKKGDQLCWSYSNHSVNCGKQVKLNVYLLRQGIASGKALEGACSNSFNVVSVFSFHYQNSSKLSRTLGSTAQTWTAANCSKLYYILLLFW